MSAVTASLCSTLMFVLFVSADLKLITAVPGQDVTLTCRAPNNDITAVKWSRDDLTAPTVFDLRERYVTDDVLRYWDGQFVPEDQHPSFKNRVDLQDKQMKDGDVSLILKDVTINDAGRYQCRVFLRETHSWRPISITYLHVDRPDQETITAASGQNVTLTCRAPYYNYNSEIRALGWRRIDLGDKSSWIIFNPRGAFIPSYQRRFFRNRLNLKNRWRNDGDGSLILKDVTIKDTGIYRCHVVLRENVMRRTIFSTQNFISIIYLHVVPPEPEKITAESGQDVTLTCRAANKKIITGVKLTKPDVEDEYVLLYRDGHFVPDGQHPSFKNRVDLQDRQMKDGDVSLILKDVTINDAGTYECRVFIEENYSWDLISIINLTVFPPYQKKITAESGQDATLTCRAPNNDNIVVAWIRADLADEYVLFSRDGQFVPDNQHPSFKNRVDLQDRQMKDGDVSLILKNATTADAGTYVCAVLMPGTYPFKHSFIYLHVFDPPVFFPHSDKKTITAKSGQKNFTLTCRAPNNNIIVVEWSRADLRDEHVLRCENGQPPDEHQLFMNRVDLQDRQMKDGDVSLILKDVTINDAGTYECRVLMAGTNSWKLINSTYLIVVPPPVQGNITAKSGQNICSDCLIVCPSGPSGGFIGLIVVILVLLLLVGVVFLIYRKYKVSQYSYEAPTENNEAPQSPQQDCVRGQTELNYPEPPADGQ